MATISKKHRILYMLAYNLLLLLCMVSSWYLKQSLRQEETLSNTYMSARKFGYDLLLSSHYLTDQVRKFSVQLDMSYYENYWKEVEIARTREAVVKGMRSFDRPAAEFDHLYKAKWFSDKLINLETRAMRLIFEVYEVPESLMIEDVRNYKLNDSEARLSFGEKINRARSLLFSKEYEMQKDSIVNNIQQFHSIIKTNLLQETNAAHYEATLWFYALAACCLLLLGLLARLLWLMLRD